MRTTIYDDLICMAFYRGWRTVQDVYGDVLGGLATPQRLYVMGACREQPRGVGELAELLHIDSAAISNLLRRMEGDGLISRRRAEGDGRGVQVSLTPTGHTFLEERDARIDQIDACLAEVVPDEDRKALLRTVSRLAQVAERADQKKRSCA